MKKYFVASDIHSFFSIFKKALDNNGWDINNSEHILIVLGDIFDRGDDTLKLYQFLRAIPKERRILIRGNHEYLLKALVNRQKFYDHDISNGTLASLLQLNNFWYDNFSIKYFLYAEPNGWDHIYDCLNKCWNSKITKECLDWMFGDEWVDYYELGNYIFTHAFIPVDLGANPDLFRPIYADLHYIPNWRTADKKAFEEATWGCPWKLFDAGLFDEEIKNNKILVCGHWHASEFHTHYEATEHFINIADSLKEIPDYTPYIGDNLIALDACTAVSGKVNIIILEEQENNNFKLINNNKQDKIIYTTYNIIEEPNNE